MKLNNLKPADIQLNEASLFFNLPPEIWLEGEIQTQTAFLIMIMV